MVEKTTKRERGNGIILFFLLAVTAIIYLPGMRDLGYYRDDWNNVFNAFTQGADMLIRHYASDRPVDGYLLSQAYTWFGPNPYPYLLVNLACRFFSGVFFFFTLRVIWPRQRRAEFHRFSRLSAPGGRHRLSPASDRDGLHRTFAAADHSQFEIHADLAQSAAGTGVGRAGCG